ncbi:LOW QUALITY PROTEIN: hypothetical protein IFM46972_10356 [Aspergillus udagawae]|uniref:Uncharacterized protein n=1 Tax=Aspergillus udagawae TaxID=91492 RepID=A0A8H3XPD1_9EURO|nr:LOW QUALITY PROTEIN: hypothetical protein IFM46972_10356 [Aspergillus udagawae]
MPPEPACSPFLLAQSRAERRILEAPAAHLEKINARLGDHPQLLDTIPHIGRTAHVHGIDLDPHTEPGGHRGADRLNNFDNDATWRARRGSRRMHQLPDWICRTETVSGGSRWQRLDARETGCGDDTSALRKATDGVMDLLGGHLAGDAEDEGVEETRYECVAQVHGDCAGGDGTLAEGDLAARVAELHDGFGVVALADAGPRSEGGEDPGFGEAGVDGEVTGAAEVVGIDLNVSCR